MAQTKFRDTAEELVAGGVTRQHVERRIADWRHRIEALYRLIASALETRYELEAGQPVEMQEGPMREFGVPPVRLPTLSVRARGSGDRAGEAYPRGLWIIGANGRIDLDTPAGLHALIDRADIFELPDWQLAPVRDRANAQPVSRAAIASLFEPGA